MVKRKESGTRPDGPHRIAALTGRFRKQLRHWVATDRDTALRVLDLIEATMRDPFRGLGKPEPLRHLGRTIWSRRITQEHRLVYLVLDDRVDFLVCRYHY
jgi:toxin YoeB